MNLKTIIRSARSGENPYFICARQPAQNKAMSYDARGLLWYLLSKPDDWKVMVPDLITDTCKRGQVYKLLRELESHGYLVRGQQRMEAGRWSAGEYVVYETPCVEIPHTVKPDTEEPQAVKRTLQNEDSTESKNLKNEEKIEPLSEIQEKSDSSNPEQDWLKAHTTPEVYDRLGGAF